MSEPLPKRQKLKTTTACEPCRSRKIRCDGHKPSCEACLKRNQQCIYHAAPDVKSANAYVDSLVNRVSQLEQELNNARNTILRLSTAPIAPPPTAPSLPDSSNIDPRLFPDYGPPSAELGPVDAMGGDAALEQLPVDGQPFYGSSSAHGFTRQVYGSILEKDNNSTTREIPIDPALTLQKDNDSTTREIPIDPALMVPLSAPPTAPYTAPENFSLLPRELADRLMQLYWDRVHLLYPVLHRRSFEQAYQDLWRPTAQHHLHYRPSSALGLGAAAGPSSPVFHCALNAALALGMQFSDLPLGEKERLSSACLAKSKDLLKMDLFDQGSLALVQTLLLLTQYFQSTNWPSKCWTAIGLACRLAQGLDLHIDKALPGQRALTPDEHEMRRRVWHGCVTLDIVVSMTLGRPAMLLGSKARSLPRPLESGEEDVPILAASNTNPSSIDFFTETVKLYRIVGRILLNVYRSNDEHSENMGAAEEERNKDVTMELNEELAYLAENLPAALKWRQSTGDDKAAGLVERQPTGGDKAAGLFERQSHVLHVRFLHARILLFRPSYLTFCRRHQSGHGPDGIATSTESYPEPLQTALDLIAAINEYSATDATGAWWYNVFYTRTAAMVVLLARACPPVFHVLGEQAWQQAWTRCVAILTRNLPQYAPVKACLETLTALRQNVLCARPGAAAGETHESPRRRASESDLGSDGELLDPFEFVRSDLFADFGFDDALPLL
ncbi:uncharacterized protein M421DRAFT_134642 [Didymella exigua CBS 183.55]|uniref:Zn(2)-C6 fungal-type domain-containing protein n=1 Tax=Didymella exigua CBS 183.55 TaxID=1150837 RepID=A0A6A5RSC5_9PLEO|nr:uncharacterized protein M421DRAFT_134642 [Didymella exigua CBS 183.55]KAF1929226.1 hypothetical protein M421DRAFT_134642 [Didymella exigua CBS 183.55]